MISALIFSMNDVERVVKLVEKIEPWVDEIVIIDSSHRDKFEELKKKLPNAKTYWLPPIGMADLYYKIGVELCKGEYILHLDDDDIPNEQLLKDLHNITKKGHVFAIRRVYPKGRGGNVSLDFSIKTILSPLDISTSHGPQKYSQYP